ncbi:hypothetical protein [Dorea formicigenerans]|nr:hypothetical protein [Dorea formicigenerans]
MEIITGYTGKPHVTSEQDRDVNIGVVGEESYVLQTGMQLAAEVSSNNEIKIRDGVLMHQGCTASIKKNTYDSLTIINGSQGMKRIDLIVARYEKNQDNRTEGLDLKVIQGTPAESNPVVPEYTEGDIQAGDYVADMPMYQVIIDGLNITEVKKVFEVAPCIDALKKEIAELNSNRIIKSGHNDNGYYRKYADGTLEMWGSTRFDNVNMQTPDNWNYYSGGRINVYLPIESKTWVSVTATASGSCAPWISIPLNGIGTSLFQAWIYSSNKSASETITIFWRCFGTWK